MKIHNRLNLLRTPDGDDGNTTTVDWKDSLPDDLKADPTIATIPDITTLAKNLVESRKFIGMKRAAIPGEADDATKWNEWYEMGGKPKTPGEYATSKVEMPEGMSLDEAKIASAKTVSHELGLNKKQFEGLTKWFLEGEAEAFKARNNGDLLERSNGEKALKDEWKNDYDKNVDIAQSALKKYGDEELIRFLGDNKLGNHPKLVKAFHKIGTELLEDTARGNGPGLGINDSTSAKLEIGHLKMDTNFMAALMKREHIGHDAATAKWTDLHKKAFGTDLVT